jgi:hypothetical protein
MGSSAVDLELHLVWPRRVRLVFHHSAHGANRPLSFLDTDPPCL